MTEATMMSTTRDETSTDPLVISDCTCLFSVGDAVEFTGALKRSRRLCQLKQNSRQNA